MALLSATALCQHVALLADQKLFERTLSALYDEDQWLRRPTVCRKLKAGLEGAISPGKGPLMRETMIHNFPHFASLVDSFFKKLYQETSVSS